MSQKEIIQLRCIIGCKDLMFKRYLRHTIPFIIEARVLQYKVPYKNDK